MSLKAHIPLRKKHNYIYYTEKENKRGNAEQVFILNSKLGEKVVFEKRSYVNHRGS